MAGRFTDCIHGSSGQVIDVDALPPALGGDLNPIEYVNISFFYYQRLPDSRSKP